MSKKNYAAAAVLAVAGIFAANANGADLKECRTMAKTTPGALTKNAAGDKALGSDDDKGVACVFTVAGDKYIATEVLDLNKPTDAQKFAGLSTEFAGAKTAANDPNEKCKDKGVVGKTVDAVANNPGATTAAGAAVGAIVEEKNRLKGGLLGGLGGLVASKVAKAVQGPATPPCVQ